jgi:hypothetical protein
MKYMGELGLNFEVYRNDELTIEDVKRYIYGSLRTFFIFSVDVFSQKETLILMIMLLFFMIL